MLFRCYAVSSTPPKILPSPPDRAWMDAFPSQHAYRCLPLSIANTHGWDLVCPESLTVHWNGGPEAADIVIERHGSLPVGDQWVKSNFSRGIITFQTGYVFQTEPGWNLLVTGPSNRPKDGISPLTGIVETNWLPYPFTMNWQLTRPGSVTFEENEPFCTVIPIPQNYLSGVVPEILQIESNPELHDQYKAWRAKRDEFMHRFRALDPETLREAWQKFYFRGVLPDETVVTQDHLMKLRLQAPLDGRLSPHRSLPPKPAQTMKGATDADKARPKPVPESASAPATERQVSTAAPGILLIEEFLSAADCEELIAAFERSRSLLFPLTDRSDGFFDNRVLWINSLPTETERRAKRIMQTARHRCIEAIAGFFDEPNTIYSDSIQLVKWTEGMSMPVHADNSNPDGRPHPTPFRKYASVIYLNDSYEGGEIFFPSLGAEIKPKLGMMVAFPGGRSHEHGIKLIKNGNRYTMPAWYTDDPLHRDPFADEVY